MDTKQSMPLSLDDFMHPNMQALALNAEEVIIYDPSVAQIDTLLDGLDVMVLPISVETIEQAKCVVHTLLNHPALETLHLLGHGAPGEIRFGQGRLSADDFAVDPIINVQLQTQRSIHFWSCRTADGEQGLTFLQKITEKSMSNVFAASGLIGNEQKGGSWDLDVALAPKPTMPFSTEARQAFEGVLAAPTLLSAVKSNDGMQIILTYSEALQGTIDASDFTFSGLAGGTTYTTQIVGSSIVFSLSAEIPEGSLVSVGVDDDNNSIVSVSTSDPIVGTLSQDILTDSIAPTITAFSSTTADGSYNAGDQINITATASENLAAGAQITTTLNNTATVVLTRDSSDPTKLVGTYTIADGDDAADLSVASFTLGTDAAAPTDLAGNAMTSTTLPESSNNIAGSSDIVIDTTAPTAVFSAATDDVGSVTRTTKLR